MLNFTKSACLVLLISFLFFGCKKVIDPERQSGDIYVSVFFNGVAGYGPAAGANIFTKPQSVQGVTDEFGSVLLKDVPNGSFEVYASLSGYGSGKAVVTVKKDSLSKIEIFIQQGVNTGIAPEVKLVLPAIPASFSKDDQITFSADISDQDSQPGAISVKWESDLDGVLHTSSPNQNGNVSFSKALSKGIHQITVTATDKDKYSGSVTFQVSTLAPKAVELVSATKDNAKISLVWKKFTGEDFKAYEVYRSLEANSANNVLLTTITDVNATTFADSLAPFAPKVFYYVKVINKQENGSNSNVLPVENPAGAVFYFTPSDAVMHPTLNRMYFVDKGANKLRVVNLDTYAEIANVTLQGTPGFIDIGDNGLGLEVYVPSSDGWIYAYDAEKLTAKKPINTGLATPCVVTNSHGYVAASVMPSPWWESPVRTYARTTGINLSGNGGFDGDRLRIIPGQDKIISISRSVSPIDMEYFELNKKGEILLHKDDDQHGSYPLDANIFRIAKSGDYLVTAGEGAVYLAAPSMEYRGQIQRGSLMFSDFAFSDDSKTIYAATQNRRSIQIARYPELTRDNEILLRGFPKYVFYRSGKLIVISFVDDSQTTFGIEIVKVK